MKKKTIVSKKKVSKQKKLGVISWSRDKLPTSKPKLAFLAVLSVLVLSVISYSASTAWQYNRITSEFNKIKAYNLSAPVGYGVVVQYCRSNKYLGGYVVRAFISKPLNIAPASYTMASFHPYGPRIPEFDKYRTSWLYLGGPNELGVVETPVYEGGKFNVNFSGSNKYNPAQYYNVTTPNRGPTENIPVC